MKEITYVIKIKTDAKFCDSVLQTQLRDMYKILRNWCSCTLDTAVASYPKQTEHTVVIDEKC